MSTLSSSAMRARVSIDGVRGCCTNEIPLQGLYPTLHTAIYLSFSSLQALALVDLALSFSLFWLTIYAKLVKISIDFIYFINNYLTIICSGLQTVGRRVLYSVVSFLIFRDKQGAFYRLNMIVIDHGSR